VLHVPVRVVELNKVDGRTRGCTYAFELAIAERPPPFLCAAVRLEFWKTDNGRCGELFCSRYNAREEHGNLVSQLYEIEFKL